MPLPVVRFFDARNLAIVAATVGICSLVVWPARGQFATVINVPPDAVPTALGPDTQLNLFAGGMLPKLFRIGPLDGTESNIEVNVLGGMVGDLVNAYNGSTLNLQSGSIASRFNTREGSRVSIRGGSVGDKFRVRGTVTMHGGVVGDFVDVSFGGRLTINGGEIGDGAIVDSDGELNVAGGSVGFGLEAQAGSTVNLSGGSIRANFAATNGSTVRISGGTIGLWFRAREGSQVTISGGEFRLDGVPVTDLVTPGDRVLVDVPSGVSMSGVLADGTPFVFTDEDSLSEGEITLEAVELPPVMTTMITASTDDIPLGLREGQTLRVDDGSFIRDDFIASRGSTVNVEPGGSIGRWFEAVGAEVNVAGMIGRSFRALDSTVHVEAGEIGPDFEASDSTITISGGEISEVIEASASTVTISGGIVGSSLRANGSNVELIGGTIGSLRATDGSSVKVSGGFTDGSFSLQGRSTLAVAGRHFKLDGQTISGLEEPGSRATLNVYGGSTLSGTLADGTPFVFDGRLYGIEVVLESTSLPPVDVTMITASVDPVPAATREGQTLVVDAGSVLPSRFRAGVGSVLTIESGGLVEDHLKAIGAVVSVSGEGQRVGEGIGDDFRAFDGTAVNIDGGAIGGDFYLENSDVTMTGGVVGAGFHAKRQSHVRVLGGAIGEDALFEDGSRLSLFADGRIGNRLSSDGSEVEINGGTVGDGFLVHGGSTVSVAAGFVGNAFRASDSVVAISGGSIGDDFRADIGSQVTITGGQIGQRFTALPGSTVSISGGLIGSEFVAEANTDVKLSGGVLGDLARVENGSHLEISGGTIGEAFQAERFSNLRIQGDEFRLNGALIEGLEDVGDQVEFVLGAGVLSGTLADGTPFAFTRADGDTLSRSVVLEASALAPIGPVSIVVSEDAVPLGIRAGQTLRADKGSVIPDHFNAGLGSTVLVEPGAVVGRNLEAVAADIHVSGGSVGAGFDAFGESVVTISGGTVGDTLGAYAGSEVHIMGTEFLLDDMEIVGLAQPGDSIVLSQRAVDLTGRLLDGNLFHFELNATLALPRDYFDPDATVRLTLGDSVPRDCDFDADGVCGLPDIDALIQALGGNEERFDLNGSGTVDRADVEAWLTSAGQKSLGRPYVFGDATLDGAVDQADLNVLGLHWQSAVTGWSRGDFNGDGQVDALDLNEVGDNWMSRAVPAQAVPEPAGWGLGLSVVVILLSRRHVCSRQMGERAG